MFNKLADVYRASLTLNLQQKGSKLEDCVTKELQKAERVFYDRLGAMEAVDGGAAMSDTPIINTVQDRRLLQLKRVEWATLISEEEKLSMLLDPTSIYVQNACYALGRKKDEKIINAALGAANTGEDGNVIVGLPSSQIIESSAEGLTIDKLRIAREMFGLADVDDSEDLYCIVTSKQISDLLKTTEVTSDEFNSVKSLVDGNVSHFMGFNFKTVSSKLLPVDDNDLRSVVLFSKSGITYAQRSDITTSVEQRADKRMATQVYARLDCGATRMDESKVIQISCQE